MSIDEQTIFISTEKILLSQLIKWMGLAETGGQACFLIDDGDVMVNGVVIMKRRKQIIPGDVITVGNQKYLIAREVASFDAR